MSIHIKKENKGKFNATKKKTGKTTEELTHSKNPVTKKRAVFAQNASHWSHQDGGTISELGYKNNSPYKNRKKLDINTPSGVITTRDMAFPITANGVVLYPDTGDYQFNTNQVTEKPMKKGGKISPNKAREILHDGTAQGHPLTDKQRRFFGAKSKGNTLKFQNGVELDEYGNPILKKIDYTPQTISSTQLAQPSATIDPNKLGGDYDRLKGANADIAKKSKSGYPMPAIPIGAGITIGEGIINSMLGTEVPRKKRDNTLAYNPYPQGTGSQAIYQDGGVFNIEEPRAKMPKNSKFLGEHVNSNYGYEGVIDYDGKPILSPSWQKAMQINLDFMKHNTPESNIYRPKDSHHSINVDPRQLPSDNPTFAKKGGRMGYCAHGGLQTYDGGRAPKISDNPFDGGTGEFQGDSHAQGGIESTFQGKPFEAEGGEPYRMDGQGNLEIFGDLVNPLTGNKFKKDGKIIASKEKKASTFTDKGLSLVRENEPSGSKWDLLKFNSGTAMLKGGLAKQKELAASKEHLSTIQKIMLEEEYSNSFKHGGGLSREKNYGSSKNPYPSVASSDFAGGGRSYPIPTEADAVDALKLAHLHNRPDVIAKVHAKYPSLQKGGKIYQDGGSIDNYKALITKYAKQYGVNPSTIENIVNTESGYDPKQVSGAGAKGIMQFMPNTAKSYGLTDSSTDEQQIEAGVKHFASLLKQNHGDEKLAVAAYNMGQGNINKFIKSSGKKASDYTGEDLMQRLETKRKDSPSSKRNLAQNQTYEYLNNVFGTNASPEEFRNKYYSPNTDVTPINPTVNPKTGSSYNFDTQLGPKSAAPAPTPYPQASPIQFTQPPERVSPKGRNGIPLEQILPAIPQVFEQPDYVDAQTYQPDLYTPYQVSFQDRINQASKSFNALAPSLVGNPEAQSVLAGQLRSDVNSIEAEEFRTNQGIQNDITNKNVSLLNDAKVRNLQIRDVQKTRQAQALANTRDRRTAAGIQIGDVLAKNRLENKTAKVYQQLYRDYAFDKDMNLKYIGDPNGANSMEDSGITPIPSKTETTTKSGNTTTRQTFVQPDYTPVNLLDNYGKRAKGRLPMSEIAKRMYP